LKAQFEAGERSVTKGDTDHQEVGQPQQDAQAASDHHRGCQVRRLRGLPAVDEAGAGKHGGDDADEPTEQVSTHT